MQSSHDTQSQTFHSRHFLPYFLYFLAKQTQQLALIPYLFVSPVLELK